MDALLRGHYRAETDRHRKVWDAELGQMTLVPRQQEGAWAGLTQMPPEEPRRLKKPFVDVPLHVSRPEYDADAERQRAARLKEQCDAWESTTCTALPRGEPEVRRASRALAKAPPFAVEGSTAENEKPRGRAKVSPRPEEDTERRRGKRVIPQRSSSTTQQGVLCAALPRTGDAFAIGNPRAESFLLQTRASKRQVEHATRSQEDEARSSSRRVFADDTGGGKSSIGFSDGALSAALPDAKTARRPVMPVKSKDPSIKGRRHFVPPTKETPLEQFATQYEREHGKEPPSAVLQDQASSLIPPSEKTSQTSEFTRWYEEEYGEAPSLALVRRVI